MENEAERKAGGRVVAEAGEKIEAFADAEEG